MKAIAMTLLMLQMGVLAKAEAGRLSAHGSIAVCVESEAFDRSVPRAQMLASEMFGKIGLSIGWEHGFRRCPAEGILVKIGVGTPESLKRGAFAYAMPYEGREIGVFYDRIHNAFGGTMLEVVLAHVLVHEISHMLEGVSRHSEQGLMKAAWDVKDYRQMQDRPLEFDARDVELIHAGLAARQERAIPGLVSDLNGACVAAAMPAAYSGKHCINDPRTLAADR